MAPVLRTVVVLAAVWTAPVVANVDPVEACVDGVCDQPVQAQALLQAKRSHTKITDDEASPPCKGWCAKNKKPWSTKCSFTNCLGCAECAEDCFDLAGKYIFEHEGAEMYFVITQQSCSGTMKGFDDREREIARWSFTVAGSVGTFDGPAGPETIKISVVQGKLSLYNARFPLTLLLTKLLHGQKIVMNLAQQANAVEASAVGSSLLAAVRVLGAGFGLHQQGELDQDTTKTKTAMLNVKKTED